MNAVARIAITSVALSTTALLVTACLSKWRHKRDSTEESFFSSDRSQEGSQRLARTQGQFRVAIDIGHTPKAPGAIGVDGTPEYAFNKAIALSVASDLQKQSGLSVFVINKGGEEVSLPKRSAVANAEGADLFLSIHHDSVNDRYLVEHEVGGKKLYQSEKFHGYSVFFSSKNPRASESRKFAEELGTAMRDEGFSPTAHHAEKIAGENRELVRPKLGVYRFDDLVVLKDSQMPAALLECGVIVNPGEEADLKTKERQARIVSAVRKAVRAMAHEKENHQLPDNAEQ